MKAPLGSSDIAHQIDGVFMAQVGKDDWEDDEPRGLVLPKYLHPCLHSHMGVAQAGL